MLDHSFPEKPHLDDGGITASVSTLEKKISSGVNDCGS
jgi:hypothetical protein